MSEGTVSLDEIVELRTEKVAVGKDESRPYIGLENLGVGGSGLLGSSGASDSVSMNSVFEPGDILFGKLRPNLRKCEQVEFSGYCSTELLVLRARSGIDARFAARVLQSEPVFDEAVRSAEGTRMPRTSWNKIRTFRIPSIPPVDQQRIAEILDAADEAIWSTERLIAKLEQAKQGLLHDLVTCGIDRFARLRDPNGYPNEFIDDPAYDCPASWKIATVGTACMIHDGPRHPISAEERLTLRGNFPYYGPTGVLDYINHYRYDGTYALIGEDGDHFLKFADRPMTQLIAGRFNVNNHAHAVQGSSECLTDWFWLFFLHRDITLHLTRQGAGRFKLSQENLAQLPIALPPLSEQRAIVDRFRLCEAKIASESAALEKFRFLKRGLMNDLLTGRVRVGAST